MGRRVDNEPYKRAMRAGLTADPAPWPSGKGYYARATDEHAEVVGVCTHVHRSVGAAQACCRWLVVHIWTRWEASERLFS